MPRQDAGGRWISDDGLSYWDGGSWRPRPPARSGALPAWGIGGLGALLLLLVAALGLLLYQQVEQGFGEALRHQQVVDRHDRVLVPVLDSYDACPDGDLACRRTRARPVLAEVRAFEKDIGAQPAPTCLLESDRHLRLALYDLEAYFSVAVGAQSAPDLEPVVAKLGEAGSELGEASRLARPTAC